MFIKTADGNLINSQHVVRIYIQPDNEGDEYSCTDVIAEMSNDATFDETLASFHNGDADFDIEKAKNFVRSLEKRLNQQNVFITKFQNRERYED